MPRTSRIRNPYGYSPYGYDTYTPNLQDVELTSWYNPTQNTGLQLGLYQPMLRDKEAWNRIIENRKQEKLNAGKGYNVASESFAKMKELLSGSEDDMEYLQKAQGDTMQGIQNYINWGDYDSALNMAMKAPSDLLNSSEFVARTAKKKALDKYKTKLETSGASASVQKMYLDRVKNMDAFSRDNDGNITSYNGVIDEAYLPKQSMSDDAIADDFSKRTAYESSNVIRNNSISGRGTQNQHTKLTAKSLSEAIRSSLKDINSEYYQTYHDQYDAFLIDYDELDNQINTLVSKQETGGLDNSEQVRLDRLNSDKKALQSKLYKNGAKMTYEEYVDNNFNEKAQVIKNKAYDHYTDANTISDPSGGRRTPVLTNPEDVERSYTGYEGEEDNNYGNSSTRVVSDSGIGAPPKEGNRKAFEKTAPNAFIKKQENSYTKSPFKNR